MFAGTAFEPPCEAGRGPDRYHLRCDRCAVGKYAPTGGYCHECPPGAGDEMVNILNMNMFEFTYFPTCQVRVVRFYVSYSFSSPFSSSSASCQLPMAMFPPGPQLKAPDGSVPTHTSIASPRRQCSHTHINRELPMAVFPPGPQLPLNRELPMAAFPHLNRELLMAAPPPGPQPRAPNGSIPTPTSTAGSGRHAVFPPHLNRELPMAVIPTRPQPQAPDGSVPHRTSTFQNLC